MCRHLQPRAPWKAAKSVLQRCPRLQAPPQRTLLLGEDTYMTYAERRKNNLAVHHSIMLRRQSLSSWWHKDPIQVAVQALRVLEDYNEHLR